MTWIIFSPSDSGASCKSFRGGVLTTFVPQSGQSNPSFFLLVANKHYHDIETKCCYTETFVLVYTYMKQTWNFKKWFSDCTVPDTNIFTWKKIHEPKKGAARIVFQVSNFRGKLAVNFRNFQGAMLSTFFNWYRVVFPVLTPRTVTQGMCSESLTTLRSAGEFCSHATAWRWVWANQRCWPRTCPAEKKHTHTHTPSFF